MSISEAQKKAQKKYDSANINFAVSYKKNDLKAGRRLKKYLKDSNQSANSYLKTLIETDLDTKGIDYPDENETL